MENAGGGEVCVSDALGSGFRGSYSVHGVSDAANTG